MIQIYDWYRTARLNVLYYEESLKRWTYAVRGYDILVALSGASSPIAFWLHSSKPILQQAWFYLTVFTAVLALLKPILRWENRLTLFAELHTRYCELYMNLKCLVEDISAEEQLTAKADFAFEYYREGFKGLESKEPPPNRKKIKRLEEKVKLEININNCWFPEKTRCTMPNDKNRQPEQPPKLPKPTPVPDRKRGIGDSAPEPPSKVQPTQEWPQPDRKGS